MPGVYGEIRANGEAKPFARRAQERVAGLKVRERYPASRRRDFAVGVEKSASREGI
jgi:hypothetical protein